MNKVRQKFGFVFNHVILLCFAIVSIYPIFWIVMTSLKSKEQYRESSIGVSWPFTLESIKTALGSQNFFRWILNSFIITGSSVALVIIITILAAYALTRLRVAGRTFILNISITLMAVPVIVMLIPLYTFFARLGLINTYYGMILIYVGITAPFSIYLLVSYFKDIPWEIIEAGVIDGCNSFTILTKIIIPMSGPAIASLVIVNALWIWNELLLALVFLPMDNTHTIMVGLTVFQSRYQIVVPVVISGLFIASLPLLVLYLSLQRFFIKGLVAGSIKG